MITIHIEPIETNTPDGKKAVKQGKRKRRNLTRYIMLIVLLVCVIIFYTMTACSTVGAPSIYQYQVPVELDDGWETVRKTAATTFVATCFALVGIFPILILFSFRWPDLELNNLLFWVTMTVCGLAGAVVLYPFSIWLVRRNLQFWPVLNETDLSCTS